MSIPLLEVSVGHGQVVGLCTNEYAASIIVPHTEPMSSMAERIPGVLKVCIQGSKSEFSSVSKVRTGIIGYYKTCF